ncbi:MAG: 2-C-methyl-D-erythritol 4-phosphate cytidylyltransferase [Bacteroidales bacterium]
MEKYVVITAGGKGERMQSSVPKQLMEIAGKPILLHVFDRFLAYSDNLHFVLVLPKAHLGTWKSICHRYHLTTPHTVTENGPTRFHSVKNGLRHVPLNVLVAIHDGARPLVSVETISTAFFFAEKMGNAVPVTTITESVRIKDKALSTPLPRDRVKVVQTPQVFHSAQIKKAYELSYQESFTDDATVLEASGESIYLTEGNAENIKVTSPPDRLIAEALLSKNTRASSGSPPDPADRNISPDPFSP